MRQPTTPCALEFMDRRSIDAIREYGGAEGLPEGTKAVLMVDADGNHEDVPRQIEALKKALAGPDLLEIQSGFTKDDIVRLWTARKSLSHAVKRIAPLKINEDVVVPVGHLANLVHAVDALVELHQLPIVAFGHAGNGNLHVNIMVDNGDAEEMRRATTCRAALVKAVIGLGGSLSGEHGIGSEKRHFVPLEVDAPTLDLMRGLKHLFDPHGILNPGKKLPD
jgi:D-lactate dehydrogenase